jgi:hypothetical protein
MSEFGWKLVYGGHAPPTEHVPHSGECLSSDACSARLDPTTALALLTSSSSMPQLLDHVADRNLALNRRADALLGDDETPLDHGGKPDDLID